MNWNRQMRLCLSPIYSFDSKITAAVSPAASLIPSPIIATAVLLLLLLPSHRCCFWIYITASTFPDGMTFVNMLSILIEYAISFTVFSLSPVSITDSIPGIKTQTASLAPDFGISSNPTILSVVFQLPVMLKRKHLFFGLA
jgi:hypothetical protein